MCVLTIFGNLIVIVEWGQVGDITLLVIVDGFGQSHAQYEEQDKGDLHTCISL